MAGIDARALLDVAEVRIDSPAYQQPFEPEVGRLVIGWLRGIVSQAEIDAARDKLGYAPNENSTPWR